MSDPQPGIQPNPGQFQPPAPQKSGIPTWAIILIAVLGGSAVLCVVGAVVVIGVLTALGSQTSQVFDRINTQIEEVQTASTAVPVSTTDAGTIGQPVANGDLEIVVQSAAPVAPTGNDLPAGKGKIYLAVQIQARNTASTDSYLAAFDTHVQDATGAVYDVSLFGQAGAESSNLFQAIAAGETLNTTYVYEVASDTTELFWVYGDSNRSPIVVKVR